MNTFDIGIQLLHPDAKLPTKANPTDSFYDVVAVSREQLDIFDLVDSSKRLEEIEKWESFLTQLITLQPNIFSRLYNYRIYGYKYGLGFALDLPKGTELQVRSRSSIYKTGLILCNGIGTGDEGYTGEYSVIFYHVVPELPPYEVGDRVAQIRCVPRDDNRFYLIDKIPNKDRGANGFGSSGLKELENTGKYISYPLGSHEGKYNLHIGNTYQK